MKLFRQNQIREAKAYAEAGGQALHLHQVIVDWQKAPACFRTEVQAGRDIAHLIDADEQRLITTAKKLGVRVIVVERKGKPGQHIDLCRGPLANAIALCDKEL